MKRGLVMLCGALCLASGWASAAELDGELKAWHKVTLTFDGPMASETGDPNPFLDYKIEVTFTRGRGGDSYTVPGYFAADGQAGYSSADSGNKWRVHFAPDAPGRWRWQASFRQGENVAVDSSVEGTPWAPLDGEQGNFRVQATDKTGRDFRGAGRLQYVGEHYLQFAESEEYFLKCGVDAPENLFAFDDFDATPDKGNRRKSWAPHAQDFDPAASDYLWGPNRDKGKNLLGAINYLASEGLNVFSFLTFNVDGDDGNVFPQILSSDVAEYEATKGKADEGTGWNLVHHTRFDVSKLDQWEKVFEYADHRGMYLHFKMGETEVDQKMDGGDLGIERKVYTRELIARFGHHLALNWNMGEETTQSVQQLKDWAAYIAATDPYDHNIVVHTYPGDHEKYYRPLLGDASALTGTSIQTSNPAFTQVHAATKKWVRESAKAGKKWIVAVDEPGDASHALITDAEDPQHDNARKNALWGAIMGGGAGVEWYFGYQHPHSDLTCQDFRSRDAMWDQCRVALNVFSAYSVPLHRLSPTDSDSDGVWTLAGEDWRVVYFKDGGEATVTVPEGNHGFGWINPRTGEGLAALLDSGTFNGGERSFSAPADNDWVLLVKQGGVPQSKLSDAQAVTLPAIGGFTMPVAGFAPGYVDNARGALAIDAAAHQGVFAAAETTYDGPSGVHDVLIETMTETDGESSYVLSVNGTQVGSVSNPPSGTDYDRVNQVWHGVALNKGDTLRVAFNSHSNGKIPEGDAFAFSRGRWTGLKIAPAGTLYSWLPAATAAQSEQQAQADPEPAEDAFVFDFDPKTADKVFKEVNGVVSGEAEHFAKQGLDDIRRWYVTSKEATPDLQPDPDDNHAEGASGGAYLEILPDSRTNHDEKLIHGVNFSNEPGKLGILYYPVEITTPGRYYVWVRCCVTGTEDNGLHVGLDGEWPESGQRMQWTGQHGEWQWDSKQRTTEVHTGVRHQIWLDIEEPGLHTIMFSMREDGFEFDKWMMTLEEKIDIPQALGPASVTK